MDFPRDLQSLFYFSDLYEATGEVLGEGSHGAVHCYVHRHTNIEYAVKVGVIIKLLLLKSFRE